MSKYYGKMESQHKASPSPQAGQFSDAHSGMPKDAVMKDYPTGSYGSAEKYNDSREGIDMLAKDNHKQMMKKPGGRY